jgi:serine/threonine protein kinase
MGVKLRVVISGSLFGFFLTSFFVALLMKSCKKSQDKIESVTSEPTTPAAHHQYCLVDDSTISPAYEKLIQAFSGKANLGSIPFPKIWKSTEIPEYILEKRIGKGSFGSVYAAFVKGTAERVALKFLSRIPEIDKALNENEHLQNEIHFGAVFKEQSRFVGLEGYFKYQDLPVKNYRFVSDDVQLLENSLVLVQRLVTGHCLDALPFSMQEIKEITIQTIVALVFLQANGIVHRDIKPENVIFDRKTNSLTFVDLGLLKAQGNPITSASDWQQRHSQWLKEGFFQQKGVETFCGTPAYLPWEVILKKTSYENDMYALGTTLAELLFRGEHYAMRFRVLAGKMLLRPELRLYFPVLMALRNPHPAGRSCLGAVMACELFSDVEWEKYAL